MLKLIRAFLNAGVMENGLVSPTDEGTPQGGPLSPLLSNLMLDDLDRELQRRGLSFARYADDCNIYVRSERAGRAGDGEHYAIHHHEAETEGKRVEKRGGSALGAEVPGNDIHRNREPKRRIAPKALVRFKERIRELTRRTRGISLERMVEQLSRYLNGWRAYFGFCQTPSVLAEMDSWIRRRLRSVLWKQWKRGKRRFAELRAAEWAGTWRPKPPGALTARGGSPAAPP